MCTRAPQSNGDILWIESGFTESDKNHVWKEKEDKTKGKKYYSNLGTGEKQWSLPGEKKDKDKKSKSDKADKADKSEGKKEKKSKGDKKEKKDKSKTANDDDDAGGSNERSAAAAETAKATNDDSDNDTDSIAASTPGAATTPRPGGTPTTASLQNPSSSHQQRREGGSPFAALPDDKIQIPLPSEYLPQPQQRLHKDPLMEDLRRMAEPPMPDFNARRAVSPAQQQHQRNSQRNSPQFFNDNFNNDDDYGGDEFMPAPRPGSPPREDLEHSEERERPGVRGMSPLAEHGGYSPAPRSSAQPQPPQQHQFSDPSMGLPKNSNNNSRASPVQSVVDDDADMEYPAAAAAAAAAAQQQQQQSSSPLSAAGMRPSRQQQQQQQPSSSAARKSQQSPSFMDVDAFLSNAGVAQQVAPTTPSASSSGFRALQGRSQSNSATHHGVADNFDDDFQSFLQAERKSREASLAQHSPAKVRHPADERRMELIDAMFQPPRPIPADEMAKLNVHGLMERKHGEQSYAAAAVPSPGDRNNNNYSGQQQQQGTDQDYLTESFYQDLEEVMSENEIRYMKHLRRCAGEYAQRAGELKARIKAVDAELGIASTAKWNEASLRGQGYVDDDVIQSIVRGGYGGDSSSSAAAEFAERLDRLQHQIRTAHREHISTCNTLWDYFLACLDADVVDVAWIESMEEI